MEGDQQKIREALEKLVEIIDKCDGSSPLWWHCGAKGVMPLKNAKAALFLPPRNCDVGTAEEQAERMRLYCNSHGEDESGCFRCDKCPFLTVERCELAWAQMPYEAQEGGANGK